MEKEFPAKRLIKVHSYMGNSLIAYNEEKAFENVFHGI